MRESIPTPPWAPVPDVGDTVGARGRTQAGSRALHPAINAAEAGALLDAVGVPVLVVDHEARVLRLNHEATALVHDPADAIGRAVADVLPVREDAGRVRRAIAQA